MPAINHGLMPNKQKAVPNQKVPPVKVATVMSPEEEEALFKQDMDQIGQQVAKAPDIEKMVETPSLKHQLDKKKALDKLMLFKQPKTKEVTIGNIVFRMKRMNADENFEVYKELVKLPAEEQMSKLDVMTLAGCLIDMDGLRIEELYSGPAEIEKPILKKYLELCTWDSSLTRVLNKVYTDFVKEAESEYTPSFLGKK